jgi:hypothetical protein
MRDEKFATIEERFLVKWKKTTPESLNSPHELYGNY